MLGVFTLWSSGDTTLTCHQGQGSSKGHWAPRAVPTLTWLGTLHHPVRLRSPVPGQARFHRGEAAAEVEVGQEGPRGSWRGQQKAQSPGARAEGTGGRGDNLKSSCPGLDRRESATGTCGVWEARRGLRECSGLRIALVKRSLPAKNSGHPKHHFKVTSLQCPP